MTSATSHVRARPQLSIERCAKGIFGLTSNAKGRFLIFGVIGLSGFIPNLATIALLTGAAHMNYVAATVVATQVAIIWNFSLLENVAYGRARSGSLPRRVAQFFALNNADLVLRIPLLAALVELAHIGYLFATAVTLVMMFAVRFLVTDRLIYRLGRRHADVISLDFGVPTAGRASLATEEV